MAKPPLRSNPVKSPNFADLSVTAPTPTSTTALLLVSNGQVSQVHSDGSAANARVPIVSVSVPSAASSQRGIEGVMRLPFIKGKLPHQPAAAEPALLGRRRRPLERERRRRFGGGSSALRLPRRQK